MTRDEVLAELRSRAVARLRRLDDGRVLAFGDREFTSTDGRRGVELPPDLARAAIVHRLVGFDLRSLPTEGA